MLRTASCAESPTVEPRSFLEAANSPRSFIGASCPLPRTFEETNAQSVEQISDFAFDIVFR
eukprot:716529-Prymnesium_polylepis.1